MSGQHGGATQWRHECACGCWMQSEVSEANAWGHIREDRPRANLEEGDLLELVADDYGPVLICNECGRINRPEDDPEADDDADDGATLADFGVVD